MALPLWQENVNTLADEIKALEVTRQTIGLKDVVSNLNIETAEEMYDDALLKSMVQQALNDSDLDRHSIIPIVKNGVVTLEGLVDHRYEVEMAGELIANVEGVIKIRNQLRNRQDDERIICIKFYIKWAAMAPLFVLKVGLNVLLRSILCITIGSDFIGKFFSNNGSPP